MSLFICAPLQTTCCILFHSRVEQFWGDTRSCICKSSGLDCIFLYVAAAAAIMKHGLRGLWLSSKLLLQDIEIVERSELLSEQAKAIREDCASPMDSWLYHSFRSSREINVGLCQGLTVTWFKHEYTSSYHSGECVGRELI